MTGFYISNVGQSCTNLCDSLDDNDFGYDFACIRLMHMYDEEAPFYQAISANDYKVSAGIVSCSTSDATDNYELDSDPSFVPSTNLCRGYKNLTSTLIDCDAVGDASVKRLCKCVDKGIDFASITFSFQILILSG